MRINKPDLERKEICGFKILDKLGEGTYATTYLVSDSKKSSDLLALKVNYFVHDRIISEINFMKIIDHPYIIKSKKLFTGEDCNTYSYSFLMEYCPISIKKIKGDHSYTFEQLLKYFYQLLSCKYYLSLNGISHNDMYPQNIALDENDNIKLLDLGIMSETVVFGRRTFDEDLVFCKNFFTKMVSPNKKDIKFMKLTENDPFFKNYKDKGVLKSFLKTFYEEKNALKIMKHKIFNPFRNLNLEDYSRKKSPKINGYNFVKKEKKYDYDIVRKIFEKSMDWFYVHSNNFSIKILFLYLENLIRMLNIDTKLNIYQIDLYSRYLACAYFNVKFIVLIRDEIKIKVLYNIVPKLQGIIGENRVLKKCKRIEEIVTSFNLINDNILEMEMYENKNAGPNLYCIEGLEYKLKLGCKEFLETYYYK